MRGRVSVGEGHKERHDVVDLGIGEVEMTEFIAVHGTGLPRWLGEVGVVEYLRAECFDPTAIVDRCDNGCCPVPSQPTAVSRIRPIKIESQTTRVSLRSMTFLSVTTDAPSSKLEQVFLQASRLADGDQGMGPVGQGVKVGEVNIRCVRWAISTSTSVASPCS